MEITIKDPGKNGHVNLLDARGQAFAEMPSTSVPSMRGNLTREMAQGGVSYFSGYIDSDEFNSKLEGKDAVPTYDRMRRTDAQIQAILYAAKLPVKGARWDIRVPEERKGTVSEEQLAFVRDNLFDNINFTEFLEHALSCLWAGFSWFEKVYERRNGRLEIAKLAPRLASSLDRWWTDDNENLIGIRQEIDASGFKVDLPIEKIALFSFQKEGNNYQGLALDLDTPIPTPDGWRTMRDLKVGDRVFDEQGKVTGIVAEQTWQDRPCYRLELDTGELIVADANHKWAVLKGPQRTPAIVTTEEMFKKGPWCQNGAYWAIEMPKPLEYSEAELLIHPYVMGWWLSDGDKNQGRIASKDDQFQSLMEECGEVITSFSKGSSGYCLKQLWARLKTLGLANGRHSGTKRLLDSYLHASIEQRTALLQGLLDGDGSICKTNGEVIFFNSDTDLVDRVEELMRSLALKPRRQLVDNGHVSNLWRLTFSCPPGFKPFRLDRKLSDLEEHGVFGVRSTRFFIRDIVKIENRDTKCIEVSNESHQFIVASHCVPTVNSLLRGAYKHWFIKDQIYHIDAIRIERFALGVPHFKMPAEGYDSKTLADLIKVGKNWKAGEQSYLITPADIEVNLLSLSQGQVLDVIPTIIHHNEEIGKSTLTQFINLGTTQSGSRALGAVDVGVFYDSLKALSQWLAEEITRQVIWPLLDLNYPDKPRPRMEVEDIGTVRLTDLLDFLRSLGTTFLTPDLETENYVRSLIRLPKRTQAQVNKEKKEAQAEKDQELAIAKAKTSQPVEKKEAEQGEEAPAGVSPSQRRPQAAPNPALFTDEALELFDDEGALTADQWRAVLERA